jgi:hypothetical protein
MIWTAAIAAALLVGTLVIAGVVAIYLPPTYFSGARSKWSNTHPAIYWTMLVAKNLLGIALIVAGIAMLVLPGQGLLTMLIGLVLLDIPGKRKFEAALIRRTQMLDSLNRWRAKFGRAPLELPE